MTKKKETGAPPLEGEYRTLMVNLDSAPAPQEAAPVREDVRMPDALKEKMARLDLSDIDPETEARRREAAVPETDDQQALVDFFETGGACTESLMAAYLRETRSAAPNDPLWLRYHHQANRHLERLIIACIAHAPTDKGLLYDLAHLSRFHGDPGPAVEHYARALLAETDWPRLRALAEDICDHEALMAPASRARFHTLLAAAPDKWQLVLNTMIRYGGGDE